MAIQVGTATISAPVKLTPNEYKSEVKPIWCPGCGDFGVLSSFYKAVSELGIPPEQMVIVSGIGCSGRFPAFVSAYGFHGVHGRALPLATGVKLANPDLVVCAIGGDGDIFSIGAGHLPHAARRNIDITVIVLDNEIYGLTKGQPSPTSPVGMERKASPYGSIDRPINPILLALAYGATFVARGFSSKPKDTTELIKQGILHKGFSFIQVLSPCVTFFDTYAHFKEVSAPLPADHDRTNLKAAIEQAMDTETQKLGVFYEAIAPSYEDSVRDLRARAQAKPFDLQKLMATFRT